MKQAPARGTVLVVDDDPDIRGLFRTLLTAGGHEVLEAQDVPAAEALLGGSTGVGVDTVLLDLHMPGETGMALLERMGEVQPNASVVVVTANLDVRNAVRAWKLGAFDYVLKPAQPDELMLVVRNAVEKAHMSRELMARRALDAAQSVHDGSAVVASAAMQDVLGVISQVKDSSVPILLSGETGTGKEVMARLIHTRSRRAKAAFVAVNCAAIPAELAESEFFGHEKGAFTGAGRVRPGRFEEADGGTLFLDEIGELDLGIQGKLLRVLQDREVTRVGGGTRTLDVRVVAATNRDLHRAVKEGSFRADLYYRLEVITLHLPPLRDRLEEIAPLARHLLDRFSAEEGLPPRSLSEDAVELLQSHDWPGNVRELQNVLKRAALFARSEVIGAQDLKQFQNRRMQRANTPPPGFLASPVPPTVMEGGHEDELPGAMDGAASGSEAHQYRPRLMVNKDLLMRSLAETHGNVSEAARRMGIGRATFYRWASRYGLHL